MFKEKHLEEVLKDKFGRNHNYLRISLTEKCNLRCTYCMPLEGVKLTPRAELATADEILEIATVFVKNGVSKIRLTGGEPLVRKDFTEILTRLSHLPVELAITTNAVLVDQYIDLFKSCRLQKINVSLDSLNKDKFNSITRRDLFTQTFNNIRLLVNKGFEVKLNTVLIKGFNDNEIIDFIELSRNLPIHVRFIEFMPFDGNQWNLDKVVSEKYILQSAHNFYRTHQIKRIEDRPNDTSRNYQIERYNGTFAIISSVTNPFCDSCNRIRLTANGRLKNCLFSGSETDLLSPLRNGQNIEPLIYSNLLQKHAARAGLDTPKKFNETANHAQNRSMITIGG